MGKQLFLLFSLFVAVTSAFSQALPANIDFETGTLSNWIYYTGTCCPISAGTVTAPVPGRHALTSGSATDPYGGFPIVAPSAGSYSFKLGNDTGSMQSERVRYYVHVPTGPSGYTLMYHYAVVLEDPGHVPADQPRMEIRAYDSATGAAVTCDSFGYIAATTIPGFLHSATMPPSGSTDVMYKSWTAGNLKFNGLGGHTIAVDFATGDCTTGGHFAYGYVDISPGLFINSMTVPCGGTLTMTAPDGYSTYTWYDSATFSTVYGTSEIVTMSAPHTATATYAVILHPYTGYGCQDTLYVRVSVGLPCPSLGLNSPADEDLTVFPNPASTELMIKVAADTYSTVEITDAVGKVLIQQPIGAANVKVDIADLTTGLYYVVFKGTNGNVVKKLVKM